MLNKDLGGCDMQEVFENIIEKLDESSVLRPNSKEFYNNPQNGEYVDNVVLFRDAIEIVKQEAEKFGTDTNVGSNGWIPCSERLPEDDSICIVTVEYPNNKTMVDYGWFDRKSCCWFVGMQEFRTSNILAWQPLPKPYQPKGE